MIEIINKIYFSSLFFALIFLNKEDEWTLTKTSIYMLSIVLNTIVVFIIVLSKIFYIYF